MKSCIFFLLLCSAAQAELVAHYDLSINQPLRFLVRPGDVLFTWNLDGLSATRDTIPVGWATGPEGPPAPGYRIGDVVDLPVDSPSDQITYIFNPYTGHSDPFNNRLTITWSCENCYLNTSVYSVYSPPRFTIPDGSVVTSATATITDVNDYANKPPNTVLWGLAVDLYGTQVPEPSGVLVLLGLPLGFLRRRV